MAKGAKLCTSCGKGTFGDRWGLPNCSYCGAGAASFAGTDHIHKFGIRVNGMANCVGRDAFGCDASDYDSKWGAGMFNDWPRGHSKPYGA